MAVKIILLVIFFGLMLAIGFMTRKHATNVSGFVLGGRSVGPWLTAFAYGTSYFSAVIFVGYAGQFGWKYGLSATWIGIGNEDYGRKVRCAIGECRKPGSYGAAAQHKTFYTVCLAVRVDAYAYEQRQKDECQENFDKHIVDVLECDLELCLQDAVVRGYMLPAETSGVLHLQPAFLIEPVLEPEHEVGLVPAVVGRVAAQPV